MPVAPVDCGGRLVWRVTYRMSELTADEVRVMTPVDGFNVVEVKMEAPTGKRLTFIEHYTTREQAERIAMQLTMAGSGRRYAVYGPAAP